MQILTILELLVAALVTLYIFYEYSAKNIPFWIKFICYVGWLLSFVMIFLVPLDVYYTVENHSVHTSKNDDASGVQGMIISWRVIYWSNFAFTWFILPTLQQYLAAGDFPPKEKFIRAIKANLRTYAIMLGCGIIFLLYLKASNRVGTEGLGNFLITFSNCFGLIIIIICLGYGLVALPKKCLKQSKQDLNLQLHHYEVGLVGEQRQDVLLDLEELIKSIDSLLRRNDVSKEDKEVLKRILADVPQSLLEDVKENIIQSSVPPVGSYAKLSKNELDSLNKKMYMKLSELRRLNTKWDVKVRNSFFLEDIAESHSPAEWRTKQSYNPSKFRMLDKMCSPFEWFYYKYVSGIVFFILGIILIVASVIVFLAEVLNFYEMNMLDVENMLSGDHLLIKTQLFCLLPLFYISSCIYLALFNMKFTGRYGLYSHHLTDAPSLIFSSLNFSRVSSPMIFNFLSIMKLKKTAFQTVMGNGLFFKSFMRYFPLLLAVLILCNIFDVFGRILGYLGLNRFRFNEESTNDKIEYGKKLLNKARSLRVRNGGVSTRGTRRNQSGDDPLNLDDMPQKDVISRGYLINDRKLKPNTRSLNDI